MTAEPRVVRAGQGSYLLGPPAGAQPPSSRVVYRDDGLTGPLPSSRWWSSAAWEPFSHPLYPLPLALQATAAGLAVGAPDVSVGVDEQFSSRAILAPFRADLTLRTGTATYDEARVHRYGDFDVGLRWESPAGVLVTTAAHGSPYVFVEVQGDARVDLHGAAHVWSDDGATVGITVDGHPYALFGPTGSTWRIEPAHCVNDLAGRSYWSVALLPEESVEALEAFRAHAHAHLRGTTVSWRYDPAAASVQMSYEVELDHKEQSEPGTLLGLFPHQWRHLSRESALTTWTYPSVRGELRVLRGSRFTTEQPRVGLLTHLPSLGNETAELAALVAAARDEGDHHLAHLYPHAERDMYWTGVSLGRIASLVPYAERVGDKDAVAEFVGWLKATLEQHFVAAGPGGEPKDTGLFWYDPIWGTVIGHPGGFGADVALNDHHYQYGYWIRAAVEVARHDPEWAAPDRWGGMVELLVRDFASVVADEQFPRLRHFDLYAGHSWATGRNEFADGANAESVSESIAASAAVLLWGELTGNEDLRDLGVVLYTTEISAAQEYWFDVHGTNFPEEFGLAMAGQVWGGKTSYSTWWTDDPEAMRGISFLPFTPASFYLGLDVDYVRRNLADLRRLRPTWTYWPDIFWCYEALADPDHALDLRRQHGDYVMGHSESHPHTLGWLLDLKALGHVNPTVASDSGTSLVFRNGRTRTYLASNPGREPRTVRFGDGVDLRVEPGHTAMTIRDRGDS